MKLEQLATLLLLAALGLLLLPRARRRNWWGPDRWPLLGALLAGALIRLFWVAPAFLHVNFHGPSLVAGILDFPRPSTFRAEYGQGSFAILGLIAWPLGRSAETVFAANAVIAALTTLPCAAVAAAWSGRREAGWVAAWLFATSPLFARLGHSEDAHNLALLFALTALALGERWRRERAPSDLAAALAAMLLALLCRQTFYPWVLLFLGLLVEGQPRGASLRDRLGAPVVAALALTPLLLPRLFATVRSPDNGVLFAAYRHLATDPGLLARIVAQHPLFDLLGLSPVVPLGGLLGAIVWWPRSPRRWSLLVGAALLFAATLPMGFPSTGVRWSFRAPVYALALVVAAIGITALLAKALAAGEGSSRRRLAVAAIAVGLLGALGGASAHNHRPDEEYLEYAWTREALIAAGPGAYLVAPPRPAEAPSAALETLLAVELRQPAGRAPGRALLLDGIGCRAFAVLELWRPRHPGVDPLPVLAAALDPAQGYGRALVDAPPSLRPECAGPFAAAREIARGPVLPLGDDPPMALFGLPQVRLRLLEPTVVSTGDGARPPPPGDRQPPGHRDDGLAAADPPGLLTPGRLEPGPAAPRVIDSPPSHRR